MDCKPYNTFTEEKRCIFWGKNSILKGFRIAGMVVSGFIAAAIFALVFGFIVADREPEESRADDESKTGSN